jgi:hypothetical protein
MQGPYAGPTGASMFGGGVQGPETNGGPMPARLPANSLRHPQGGNIKSLNVGIDFGTARSGYAYAYGTDNIPQLQVALAPLAPPALAPRAAEAAFPVATSEWCAVQDAALGVSPLPTAPQFNWPGETVQQAKTITELLYDKRSSRWAAPRLYLERCTVRALPPAAMPPSPALRPCRTAWRDVHRPRPSPVSGP